MYHSLIFQYGNMKFNTWDNWHLIPVSRPTIEQPTPNYTFVDIPGADGSVDITDYLIGRPTYSDRQGSFEFYVANDYGNAGWEARRASIAKELNGRKMKLYFEDDPMHYYEGRFFFKKWTPDASHSKVTIEYRVKPYRYTSNGKEDGL